MPSQQLVSSPQLLVNGVELPADEMAELVDVRVTQTIGVPSELTIRFADRTFVLIDGPRYVVGNPIEVKFPDEQGTLSSVFEGEIVSVGLDQDAGGPEGCELTVTALDKSHRLGRATKIRTFQNMKHSDVVRTIASEHGLQAQADDTTVVFEYLIQTTTDYAFLQELAFRSGYEWRVVGTKLVFKKRASTAPITVTYGENMRRIRARYSAASEVSDVKVRAWDPKAKKPVQGAATLASLRSAGATGGTSPLVENGRSKAKPWAATVEAVTLVATSHGEANQLAGALGRQLASGDLILRCECYGDPRIGAGSTVKIERAGTKLSGDYYVTSAEHYFGQDGDMRTVFSTGPAGSASVVDLLGGAAGPVNPFGQLGLTIGLVTNNKDPDGVGRVRVKFPALSDSEESWWAPVVSPGGGNQAGLMFMPQIDDEVLVGFEHGDLRRPFVLGGLWGAKAKPPTATDTFLAQNKVVEWGVKTMNSTTLTIRSGDQPADKHYKFALPDGTTHYIGADKTEIIAQNKSIELKSGQASIKITDTGDIEIKGNNIKIDATQALTVNGMTIEAKAKTSFKAEGSAALELKGGASAKLSAGGVTEISGAALVKIQ